MPKYKNINITHHGTIHTNAYCQECQWTEQDNRNGVAANAANKHCKETGHSVRVEKGTSYTITPKVCTNTK